MILKKWMRLLILIPLVVFLVLTNVHVDPASIYHDYSEAVAMEIINGNKPYFSSFNGDDRGVKQHLIENIPKHVECITVGPSLSLGITRELVGTDDYYNLSVHEANINDIMAEFALLDINEVKTDRLILCVDPYFFDELHSESSQKQEWMPYAESYDIDAEFEYGKHVNSEKFEYFDKLINYLLEQGVEIELYMCPLCPSLWDRLDTDSENCQFYILNEIEEHARNVAETYDLKVTGSYNPYNLGVKDSDYYDSRHFRHDRLGEYFDFSE